MRKGVLIGITAISLTAFVMASSWAATVKCNVTEVSGNTVTFDCGSKAGTFNNGDSVKVKSSAKTTAIEGC